MRYIYPISILSGTIIGAGMFSLPFIFVSVGFWFGTLFLAVFAGVFWLTHTMYADIMLRTDHEPRFVGYVKNYLGAWAYWPAVLATVFGVLLGSTIYLVLSESFASLVFFSPAAVAGTPYVFWVLGSGMIFAHVKNLARTELAINIGIAAVVFLVFFFGMRELPAAGYDFSFSVPKGLLFFLPFGPILFSLAGRSAVPSVLKDMRETGLKEDKASRVIFWGTALPAVLYFLFVLGILGLSPNVTDDAVSGLFRAPAWLLSSFGGLVLISLFSTYVLLGISVKDILRYDFGFSPFSAGAVVVSAPLALYALGLRDFIFLVSISGGIFLALESIFIALIWRKLNALGKPRLLLQGFGAKTAYAIILVFAAGMLYEILRRITEFYAST